MKKFQPIWMLIPLGLILPWVPLQILGVISSEWSKIGTTSGILISFFLIGSGMASGLFEQTDQPMERRDQVKKTAAILSGLPFFLTGMMQIANMSPQNSVFEFIYYCLLFMIVMAIGVFYRKRNAKHLSEKELRLTRFGLPVLAVVFIGGLTLFFTLQGFFLFLATYAHKPGDVQLALKFGAKPTPRILNMAVESGDVEITEKLLKAGADPNAREDNLDPMYWAIVQGYRDIPGRKFEVLKLLVEAGADPNKGSGDGQRSWEEVLRWSDESLRAKALELLLKKGLNPNSINIYGDPAFMSATHREDLTAMELLQKSGADINAPDKNGWTPFRYAAENGKWSALRMLMLLNANPTIRAKDGKTPLESAGSDPVLYEMLKAYQKKYEAGKTPAADPVR